MSKPTFISTSATSDLGPFHVEGWEAETPRPSGDADPDVLARVTVTTPSKVRYCEILLGSQWLGKQIRFGSQLWGEQVLSGEHACGLQLAEGPFCALRIMTES